MAPVQKGGKYIYDHHYPVLIYKGGSGGAAEPPLLELFLNLGRLSTLEQFCIDRAFEISSLSLKSLNMSYLKNINVEFELMFT